MERPRPPRLTSVPDLMLKPNALMAERTQIHATRSNEKTSQKCGAYYKSKVRQAPVGVMVRGAQIFSYTVYVWQLKSD